MIQALKNWWKGVNKRSRLEDEKEIEEEIEREWKHIQDLIREKAKAFADEKAKQKKPPRVIRLLALDADGTIRRSKSGQTFIRDKDDIELIPGVQDAIQRYVDEGWKVAIFSNQAGIAHGFKTEQQVEEEFQKTTELFEKKTIAAIYWCPFDEKGNTAPFSQVRSLSRKPNIGMLAQCEEKFRQYGLLIDWDSSLFVGDRKEDQECAKNAGMHFQWAKDFVKDQTPLGKTID